MPFNTWNKNWDKLKLAGRLQSQLSAHARTIVVKARQNWTLGSAWTWNLDLFSSRASFHTFCNAGKKFSFPPGAQCRCVTNSTPVRASSLGLKMVNVSHHDGIDGQTKHRWGNPHFSLHSNTAHEEQHSKCPCQAVLTYRIIYELVVKFYHDMFACSNNQIWH